MRIIVKKNYELMSRDAAEIIVEEIKNKPDLLLCAATGDTPTGTYGMLAEKRANEPGFFEKLRVIKLDEWGGVDLDDPATCETYIQEHVTKPLGISADRYITFDSNPKVPEKEMEVFDEKIHGKGPIGLCILGLGMDGHVALNEPAEVLEPHAHVNKLADTTRHHSMAMKAKGKIKYGLTMGMEDIMGANKILLLVNGKHKQEIFKQFLSEKITTELPASMLWMHPDVICICDEDAAPLTLRKNARLII